MESLKSLPLLWHLIMLSCAGGALWQGVALWQTETVQRLLDAPDNIVVDEHSAPLLIFAKARRLAQSGNPAEAIRLYASLAATPDAELRARALHNLATLYLQDAARRWNAHGVLEAAHVSAEVELAKQNYREALRLNPDDWDARFNLEYAWRITPPPKEKAKADFQGSKSSVFSTLPGLPGGGP